MKKKMHAIALGGLGLFMLILLLGLAGRGSAAEDADDLARQALELRMKARRGHCEKLATRISACYSGDTGACLKMQESIAWFTNEYGESPELSCPSNSPFGEGDGGL